MFFMMSDHFTPRTLDGLPLQFVSAMRTLFEIMDDRRTGFIKFVDIECRWQEGASRSLPRGFVDSLRKVTPPNGLLSFERFCAGLKICLLRHKSIPELRPKMRVAIARPSAVPPPPPPAKQVSVRPASVPLPEVGKAVVRPSSVSDRLFHEQQTRQSAANTATVRPNNAMVQQRAVSMPLLQSDSNQHLTLFLGNSGAGHHHRGLRSFRSDNAVQWNSAHVQQQELSPGNNSSVRKSGILQALENWRMGVLNNEANADGRMFQIRAERVATTMPDEPGGENHNSNVQKRTVARSKSSSAVMVARKSEDVQDNLEDEPLRSELGGPAARRAHNRKREPRRHTLTNGIDYSMLKRMKQMEQERDILLQGLEMVERTRDWYVKQVSLVQEKMHYMHSKNNGHAEYSSDVYQERLNLQMTRVLEVNQHLNALIESSEKGNSLHMNLALKPPSFLCGMSDTGQVIIQRLKVQNRMLTEEVGRKSERITQLEKEKGALVRELFQARTTPPGPQSVGTNMPGPQTIHHQHHQKSQRLTIAGRQTHSPQEDLTNDNSFM